MAHWLIVLTALSEDLGLIPIKLYPLESALYTLHNYIHYTHYVAYNCLQLQLQGGSMSLVSSRAHKPMQTHKSLF